MSFLSNLTVILITLNEEKDIEACLESCSGLTKDIVVVDAGSTDRTGEICKKYTSQVYQKAFEGFSQQKQFALDKAKGPWVLNIDADERVSNELGKEIQTLLSGDPKANQWNGFSIPFRHFFLGQELRFGGVQGEKHIRLFRKDRSRYGIEKIHEGILVKPPVGHLRGAFHHHSYRDVKDYLEKCNRYTSLIADEKFSKGERFRFFHYFRMPYEFMVRYFLKLGILDRGPGFIYALLSSYYVFLKYIKLRELQNKS